MQLKKQQWGWVPPNWCAEIEMKLGPFQSSPVPSGPFAWRIVPLESRINLQTRLGPLLEIQRRIILARLVVSGEKT